MPAHPIQKTIIFGNSGSGKSTLAKELCERHTLAHLDLDSIAWLPQSGSQAQPTRRSIADSLLLIDEFMAGHKGWVIEGCYADLLALVVPKSNKIIFLNLSVSDCIANAKQRPWESHKYESKQAQDANLQMLIAWISDYTTRTDSFSQQAHSALFEAYPGDKVMYTSNAREGEQY